MYLVSYGWGLFVILICINGILMIRLLLAIFCRSSRFFFARRARRENAILGSMGFYGIFEGILFFDHQIGLYWSYLFR
jgi:hypothetical protein